MTSLHQELRGSRPFYHELTVNHEFSDAETKARETNITGSHANGSERRYVEC